MARIFISYSQVDGSEMQRIKDVIDRMNHTTIVDATSFAAAIHLIPQIRQKIEEADFLCPILSPNAALSQWVNHEEIPYAVQCRVRILPILMKECEIPSELRNIRYVDFTGGFENGAVELCKNLPRAGYDEIEFLRSTFDALSVGTIGPKFRPEKRRLMLLDILREAVQEQHRWAEKSAVDFMEAVRKVPSAKGKVNDVYWWLMNYGVLRFKGITAEEMCFANEDWRVSVRCALLTDRGRAFLTQLALETATWNLMRRNTSSKEHSDLD